ncbi:MAG: hypothetical protein JXP73_22310 [Deltaproteobacteria bacterium]|nr:hypothetical protein [Deltaproteobacteria bacterium]
MKSIVGIIGIATLALVGLSAPAFAQRGGLRDIKAEPCLAALHLSRPQERRIESYLATALRQSRHLQARIDRAEDELRILARMRRPNPNAIARKRAELDALRSRERGIWFSYRLQVQAVLNPMQRATWAHCSHRVPAPALVGPVWQGHPHHAVAVQAKSPKPMARR